MVFLLSPVREEAMNRDCFDWGGISLPNISIFVCVLSVGDFGQWNSVYCLGFQGGGQEFNITSRR